MSAARGTGRRTRGLAALAAAGLTLAACNSPSGAKLVVTGHPSISIEVPLSMTACALDGSCVAVGTTAITSAPPVTAQYRAGSGAWAALATPSGAGASLTSSSCWSTGCLLGGTSTGGDLVWHYDARVPALRALVAPALGESVTAISCFGAGACDLIDTAQATGAARLVATTDAGATWSTPEELDVTAGDHLTQLACVSALDCAAVEVPNVGSSTSDLVLLEVTHDGGITFQDEAAPANAVALSSLTCSTRGCDALVTTPHRAVWAYSRALGTAWVLHRLGASASALACTAAGHCVIVGVNAHGPWVGVAHAGSVVSATLAYVPSPFTAASCGATLCALSGPSTVASLRP